MDVGRDALLRQARSAQRSALPRRTSFPGLISTCHHPFPILLAATEQAHVTIVELYPVVILLISMSHWKMLFSIELLKSTGKDNNCRGVLALPYFLPEV